jgi:hypothetical protein
VEDYRGQNLCFIIGAPRSGTTWLQRLIASHPLVHTGPESYLFFWYVGPQLKKWKDDLKIIDKDMRGGVGLGAYFLDDEYRKILKDYAMNLMKPMIGGLKNGEFFLEKSPLHAFSIGAILELFPESRFIHILRDARDVVSSLIVASHSWANVRLGNLDARSASKLWVSSVWEVERSKKLVPQTQFMEVRYENLRESPSTILEESWRFLGLKYDGSMLKDAVERNDAAVFERLGTKIPMGGEAAKLVGPYLKEPEGFVRSGGVGSWKKDLSFVQKVEVWAATRKLMKRVGYDEPFPL